MADDIDESIRELELRLSSLRETREALLRIEVLPKAAMKEGQSDVVVGTTASALFYTTEPFLHRMLTLENEMRLSQDTQELYSKAEEQNDTDWLEVTDQLQRRLLQEQGGVNEEDLESALLFFRSATYTYPSLAAIPIYRRFQRARSGRLAPGDLVPDVTSLLTLEGSHTTLLNTLASFGQDMPVMICTGSIS